MALTTLRRAFVINVLLAILNIINNGQAQGIPQVKLQAFKPKGFRVYIHDTPYLDRFVFHGNVNEPIKTSDKGSLSGEVYRATNGKWIFEDFNLDLEVGDVVNYYVFVSYETVGYLNNYRNFLEDNLTFTVTEKEERNLLAPTITGTLPNSWCGDTLTKIFGGRTACAGETIFEDNFDNLREDVWQIEHYIPIHDNDEPFVSYQRLATNPTVSVRQGNLRIAPTLQQNLPGFSEESITSGNLSLFNGCTSEAETCFKVAQGSDILPPIVSGRVTSNNFAFKYGTIHVRAKVPIGDWLYPDLLLEPLHKYKYGRSKFASGVMKIASVRGNLNVNTSTQYAGNNLLYGGLLIDNTCRNILLYHKTAYNIIPFGNAFHIYSMRWDPDGVTLGLDGKEWAYLGPKGTRLVDKFPKECMHVQRAMLAYMHGSKLAPFDDYFYIALGVAAGGTSAFIDNTYTGTDKHPKPWSNDNSTAMFTFWEDMNHWFSTWDQPELLIDYVRVDAL